MGVVNTKSTLVTNADAAVQTLNPNHTSESRVYTSIATVETAAADDDGSVFRFFRVHSSWSVLNIFLYCDTITAGTVYDCGLYQIAANGGAVLDADCYAANQTLATALTTLPIDLANHTRDIALMGQKVWADGSLTADSNRWYDLCLTGDTVGSAAGTITLRLNYTRP